MAKSALVLLVAAAVVLIASVENAEGAISCNQVTNTIMPCANYIIGSEAAPSGQCCSGIKNLNSLAKSAPDRQGVCQCLKNQAGSFSVNYGKAAKLPGLCGVNLNVPISSSVDCSKVR